MRVCTSRSITPLSFAPAHHTTAVPATKNAGNHSRSGAAPDNTSAVVPKLVEGVLQRGAHDPDVPGQVCARLEEGGEVGWAGGGVLAQPGRQVVDAGGVLQRVAHAVPALGHDNVEHRQLALRRGELRAQAAGWSCCTCI